ncbi:MAG: presenilin family intramembrane aspartyl protease PSH [Methanocellales archaeon]
MEPEPISRKLSFSDFAAILGMGFFLLIVEALALFLVRPFQENNMQIFEEPTSIWNPVAYIVIILSFTIFILITLRYGKKWMVQAFIGFAVMSTLLIIFDVFTSRILPQYIASPAALALTVFSAVLLYKYPEWYVIDTVGIVIGAGAASLFGISLAILPTIVLLIALAVYDAISVYKTRHMIKLAEGVLALKIPVLLVIPKKRHYSYRKQKSLGKTGEREAYFMGLGDAVIPAILVVSANVFMREAPGIIAMINYPALGAMIGSLIGFAVLMTFVVKGKPQAGLPLLNAGAISGFLFGCLASGISFF